jgi:hypothetical protein
MRANKVPACSIVCAVIASAAVLVVSSGGGYAQQTAPAGPDPRYKEGAGMRGSLDYYNPYAASKDDPYDSYRSRLPIPVTPIPGAAVLSAPGNKAGMKSPASPNAWRPSPGTAGPGVRRQGSISSTQPLPRTIGEPAYQVTPPPYYPKGSNPYYDMNRSQPYYDEYGRIRYGPREVPNYDAKGIQQGRQWYKNMPYRNPPRDSRGGM